MGIQTARERPVKTRRMSAASTKKPDAVALLSKSAVFVCDDTRGRIAKQTYELYMDRGCRDGHALDDWLEAEREVMSQVQPM